MDRRSFVGLFAAIPVVVAFKVDKDHYSGPKKAKPYDSDHLNGPYDTDDREYDEWLSKDEMHL